MEYAKYLQYAEAQFVSRLSEKEEEDRPYRYVRTFSAESAERPISEMDKEELQTFINRLLGAKGLDGLVRESTAN